MRSEGGDVEMEARTWGLFAIPRALPPHVDFVDYS